MHTDAESLKVSFTNTGDKKIDLRLKNADGKTIYFEKIKAGETYAAKLILKEVPDGQYSINLAGERIHNIRATDGKISIITKP